MQLEDYFDFNNPNGIRIGVTRVNLEDVVYAAKQGETPSQIVRNLPSLTLEQVHAALTYYYRNLQQVEAYMKDQEAAYNAARSEHEQGERSEVVERLLNLRAEREGRVSEVVNQSALRPEGANYASPGQRPGYRPRWSPQP